MTDPPAGRLALVPSDDVVCPRTPVRAFVPPRLLIWLIPLILAMAIAACGDEEGGSIDSLPISGPITDPRSVPTATPWPEPPPPIFLEEGAITPIAGEERPRPVASGDTYIVQPGDSPFSICEQFGCDYTELMELNGITDPTTLRVGQELLIPPSSQ